MFGPFITGWMGAESDQAGANLDDILARISFEELPPEDRQLGLVALVHALIGGQESAKATLTEYEAKTTSTSDPRGRARADIARALVLVQEGDPSGIAELESAVEDLQCPRCRQFYLGTGYESAGQSEPAIAAYERYLSNGFFDGNTIVLLVPGSVIHERLGALYDAAGDAPDAIRHYAAFAELWKGADPGLQARVKHAEERIAELQRRVPSAGD